MKCRHFLSFAFVVLFAFFFGSFIITQNSFALDDLVLTFDKSSSPVYIAQTETGSYRSFTSYPYIVISCIPNEGSSCSVTNGANTQNYSLYEISNDSSSCGFIPIFPNSIDSIFPNCAFGSDSAFIKRIKNRLSSESNSFSIKVTFTDSFGSSSDSPSGDLSITSNGIYDVSSYATATVNVPPEVIQGDYHDDLVNIQKSIIVCGAILLVLYFFYCIYRLIIKNSGVH